MSNSTNTSSDPQADPLSDEAGVDRMVDASMLAHRLVRLGTDALSCLGLAAVVWLKYSAFNAASLAAAESATNEPAE